MTHRLIPAMIALVAAAQAADPTSDKVLVRDFAIDPMGNLGSDNLKVHPKLMLTGGSDSNVFATENDAKSDVYVSGVVGAEVRYNRDEALRVTLDLQGRIDRYQDQTKRDLEGGTGKLMVDWKGDLAAAGVAGNYARFNDPLVQTGEQIERENIDGSAYLGWEGIASKGRLWGGARRVDYKEDAGGFLADERSYTGALAGVRFALLGAENTQTYAVVEYSSWNYESQALLNDGYQVSGKLGWQTMVGGRATLLLEGGVDVRRYDEESGPGADDKEVVLPLATIALVWPWQDGSQLSLRGYAAADNSLTSNAYAIDGVQLAGRVAATQQLAFFASVDGMYIADTAAATGAEDEVRITGIGALGAEFTAVRGVAIRVTGRQTISEADRATADDYERTEAVVDLAVAF